MSVFPRIIVRAVVIALMTAAVSVTLMLPARAQEGVSERIKFETDQLIGRHRMGTLTVKTAPGATVRVTQQRHDFQFGTALSSGIFTDRVDPAEREKYLQVVRDNFNAAVPENAMKWPSIERERGQVDYTELDNMLAWCEENDITMRGHNIYWGIEQFVQDWIKELDNAELTGVLARRGISLTSRYRGRIPEYDLNNEMVHGDWYAERLGPNIIKSMAYWAKAGDPDAVLYVNDYDMLTVYPGTEGRLNDYIAQIQEFLDNGVPIGGIGCQAHFHARDIDFDLLKDGLDRLAQFDLPIKMTEYFHPGQFFEGEMTPEMEQQQAETLVNFFRTCFAHPSVEGVYFWGFKDGRIWRSYAAMWNSDWTPRPVVQAYRNLIFDEWWTNWDGTADERGICMVPVFYGTHQVEANGASIIVSLPKSEGMRTVVLE